jgi:hypothetical protein
MLEQLTFDKPQYLLMTYCRSVAGVAAAKEINVNLQNFDLDKTRELRCNQLADRTLAAE